MPAVKWGLILALAVTGSAPAGSFKVSATVVGPDQTRASNQQVSAELLIKRAHVLRAELIAANALHDQALDASPDCAGRAATVSPSIAEASSIYFRLNETLPHDADVAGMSQRALLLIRSANRSLEGCGTNEDGLRLAELEHAPGFTYMQNLIRKSEFRETD